MFRRLNALRRLLLEGVDDPEVVPDLQGINDTVRIAVERKRDFHHAGAEPLQRLSDIGFATFHGDSLLHT